MRCIFSWAFAAACGAIVTLSLSGCKKSASDYISPDEVAQQAVESALRAWQEGKSPGILEGTKPPVQVVDGQWQSGQKLKNFEILGEEETEGAPRWFAVKLMLDPHQEQEVHYVVVGKGSVIVFRDEDYRRTVGMENNPPMKRKAKSGPPARR